MSRFAEELVARILAADIERGGLVEEDDVRDEDVAEVLLPHVLLHFSLAMGGRRLKRFLETEGGTLEAIPRVQRAGGGA